MSSTSEVFAARPVGGGDHVAIKRLLPHALEDPAQRAYFDHEVRAAMANTHPGLVQGLEVIAGPTQQGDPCLVMTLVEGTRLPDLLNTETPRPSPPESALAHVAHTLASALHTLHDPADEAMVHGDVSARNIIAHTHGDFTLLDLGPVPSVANPPRASGTPRYVCPERLKGHPVTTQGDIYSLGVILWELACGRRWTAGPPCATLPGTNPRADSQMGALINRCIAHDPDARPSHAKALTHAVEALGLHLGQARSQWQRWAWTDIAPHGESTS